MLNDPAVSLTLQSTKVEVAKSGDLAYSEASYKLTVTDSATHKPIKDHSNYLTTLRKQADGSLEGRSRYCIFVCSAHAACQKEIAGIPGRSARDRNLWRSALVQTRRKTG